ncbi:MAG: DHA1 family tetracycline resistance protein-like MFS transporter [Halieaceae bacterium]|jgi:DHA1 family tetracycline resistance protein-like MFS transporter
MFGTVHNRTVAAIVMVNFVSISGFGLMFPVFATLGNQIGASATELAWAIAGFSTGQLIAAPITGRLSDRFGRKPVLVVSLLLGSIAYWLNGYVDSPGMLIAARFGSGLASGGFAVAFAVASDISTRETRTKVMGIVGAGFSAGIIFGPAIGGFLGGMVPPEQAFATVCHAASVLNLLAAAVTALLLPETRVQRPKRSLAVTASARSALIANPAFYMPVLIGFAAMACVAMMEGTFVIYAQRILALSPIQIGLVFAVMGTCSVLVQATVAGRLAKRFGEYGMLLLAMIVQASGLICLGFFSDIALVIAGTIAISVGYAILTPAVSSLASFAADDDSQGMAQGLVQGASALGRVVGPATAGPIYDGFGPTAPFLTGGVQLLIIIVLAAIWRPVSKQPEAAARTS